MRLIFWGLSFVVFALTGGAYFLMGNIALYSLAFTGPIFLIGVIDSLQSKHTIRKNFPVIGNFRYMLEVIRPEIQQYFIENNEDGKPFSREKRSLVYQRAKNVRDTVPFGTQLDMYKVGVEWVNHSIIPKEVDPKHGYVMIGEKNCSKPYNSSRLNISAMSFGSLSPNAVLALNKGAKMGNFAHNTGEGSISKYHKEFGGDLIYQIGTGYFGCRNADGTFSKEKFQETAQSEQVKMIEIKLSQGAKPGHGGILPGAKVTQEIADARGVEVGKTVHSPPSHSAFSNPKEMLEYISNLRELSGGKPVGIKMCVGKRREVFSMVKAMHETGMTPDFITIDGAEGGTGAAPLEFTNSIGTPLNDGLIFVHNALVGMNLRKDIKIIASGKVLTGFNMTLKLALGADACYSARGMMFAIGCIQALRCNSNDCPAGVATQHKGLWKGLDVESKAMRVKNFHDATIKSFLEVVGTVGVDHPDELMPWHIQRRISHSKIQHYGEIYDYLEPGQLLSGDIPESYIRAWGNASVDNF